MFLEHYDFHCITGCIIDQMIYQMFLDSSYDDSKALPLRKIR